MPPAEFHTARLSRWFYGWDSGSEPGARPAGRVHGGSASPLVGTGRCSGQHYRCAGRPSACLAR